ncbi:hypothetical protein NPIL_456021 [Nephila pilipes]|uniref:Uncharacterized protein n=1 Tax=Nephila pilipes TaxID=299642 RepID=A0A8X6MM07_NEPPI|nr:hypothetical protein NPIL_456021 [Nephila pilipes]
MGGAYVFLAGAGEVDLRDGIEILRNLGVSVEALVGGCQVVDEPLDLRDRDLCHGVGVAGVVLKRTVLLGSTWSSNIHFC